MLDNIFISVLNTSLTASYIILFVLFIRFFTKSIPKFYIYLLWSVVLIRLLLPFSFQSNFSIFSLAGQSEEEIRPFSSNSVVAEEQALEQNHLSETIVEQTLPQTSDSNIMPENIFAIIWQIGVAAISGYAILSLIKLNKAIKNAVHLKYNIYTLDNLNTAFVFGAIKPKIYISSSLNGEERDYILLHEQLHIKRYDHILRAVYFAALAIHWFNPLVWVAFFVSAVDMEMSCDEAVISKLGTELKQNYSKSLLSFATNKNLTSLSPIAFSDNAIKGRIHNLLNYKKLNFWMAIVAIVFVLALAFALVADPSSELKDGIYQVDDKLFNELGFGVMDDIAIKDNELYITEYRLWKNIGELTPLSKYSERYNQILTSLPGEESKKILSEFDDMLIANSNVYDYIIAEHPDYGLLVMRITIDMFSIIEDSDQQYTLAEIVSIKQTYEDFNYDEIVLDSFLSLKVENNGSSQTYDPRKFDIARSYVGSYFENIEGVDASRASLASSDGSFKMGYHIEIAEDRVDEYITGIYKDEISAIALVTFALMDYIDEVRIDIHSSGNELPKHIVYYEKEQAIELLGEDHFESTTDRESLKEMLDKIKAVSPNLISKIDQALLAEALSTQRQDEENFARYYQLLTTTEKANLQATINSFYDDYLNGTLQPYQYSFEAWREENVPTPDILFPNGVSEEDFIIDLWDSHISTDPTLDYSPPFIEVIVKLSPYGEKEEEELDYQDDYEEWYVHQLVLEIEENQQGELDISISNAHISIDIIDDVFWQAP